MMGNARTTAVEWIHPSWRDLLIEHLEAHPGDRRDFLSRCGVNGILLAVSRAGGSTGKREFPLLVDAEDWKIINDAICRNVKVASKWEMHQSIRGYTLTHCGDIFALKAGEAWLRAA